ncbi:uncharacterized protein LOC123552248 [Mercenaria mercenaria]|uniref:uncharacterized protein LOC123552248 n=1 Tax=Mercenaria mercenaria TaxID=6596 RepID=UPI00234E3B51|nr:uncharacterized protein LOC123552248 [Mercenaria mercenaria]XP_045197683.2 uncharacterized protein LOC123552248 [Mercenaria mercenaria]XP_045197684.2 uncharacterized protein LOC123552248 [Mercenaria mercenaria]XP_045197685.2 uncharacterized protein LOC123552248 [Mercenaria mercenaria]XP_045197687.2 uncharacterized protein LOC123552248 [Mercenaria mercenaria]XP_045197688.2 uncharacterized protein LOC123552248 [Mercenaria mercenaria]XP_045197689.2 uncharacterized protein LOC123552248 [Mercen
MNNMAMQGRVNDPLFHFETHFPERLSRLHLNPEYSGHPVQRKNKRSRARNGARYKTQPVTFDEIQEVDEENIKEEDKTDGLKHQFAAFSKSMDGLVPRFKSKLADDVIQEVVEVTTNDVKPNKTKIGDIGRIQSDSPELRLQSVESDETCKENKENEPSNGSKPENAPLGLPPSGPNTRRQRTTAKAKKRQMQAEVQGGGDKGT